MTDNPQPAPVPAVLPEHLGLSAEALTGSLAGRMGMELLEVSAERSVARMPVAGNTQPYGLLHGGASAALAETVASLAAATHAGPGRIAVGVDLSATHHRAVREGFVTAVATPLALGRSLACYEIVVSDDEGRRVCTSRLTCALRDRPPGA
jgi:uncharacterized protein (TIGR00369 family)